MRAHLAAGRARGADLARAGAAGDRRRAEAGAAAARAGAGPHPERRHGLARPEPARRARRRPGGRAMGALLALVPRAAAGGMPAPGDFFRDAATGGSTRRGDAPAADFVYAGAQILDPARSTPSPTRRLLAEPGLGRAARRGPAASASCTPAAGSTSAGPRASPSPRRSSPGDAVSRRPTGRGSSACRPASISRPRWSPGSTPGSRDSRRRRRRGSRSGSTPGGRSGRWPRPSPPGRRGCCRGSAS